MDVTGLTAFKDYLADRPETAILALSIMANVYLYRAVIKAKDAHMAALEKLLPLAEKMTTVIGNVATRARRNRPDSPPGGVAAIPSPR